MNFTLKSSITLGAILFTTQVFAYPVNFIGVWKNTNPSTKGIVSIVITPGLSMRLFGACVPAICDLGVVPLTTFGANVSDLNHRVGVGHYILGFKKIGTALKLVNNNKMTLEHFNQFTDSSGRQNYWMSESFKKVFPLDKEELENNE
jgi:hypothetical protein